MRRDIANANQTRRLADRWIWIVSVSPFGTKAAILPLHENLRIVPIFTCLMRSIYRNSDRCLLGIIRPVVLPVVTNLPLSIVVNNNVLCSCHINSQPMFSEH